MQIRRVSTMTPADQLADDILKAAGSRLHNYTTRYSREKIRFAAERPLIELVGTCTKLIDACMNTPIDEGRYALMQEADEIVSRYRVQPQQATGESHD